MTDRVYPQIKPNGTGNATATTPVPAGPLPAPPSKSHPYNPTRHPYRPTPPTRPKNHLRSRRSFSCRRCCCLTCCWSILILIAVILLAAIAAGVFYVLYHPHRPAFSVTSLRISAFNLTATPADGTTRLTTRVKVTLSAKNPNKKITFFYDPFSISVQSPSTSLNLANGTSGNFTNSPDSIYIIHSSMATNNQVLDSDSLNSLDSDLKRRNGLPMRIVMDTMVGVKLEKLKMRKVGIRVKCDDIHGMVPPRGRNVTSPAVANTSRAKCKVDLRIKIWKWTF